MSRINLLLHQCIWENRCLVEFIGRCRETTFKNSFKTPDPLLTNALTNEDNRVIGQDPKLDNVSETICDLPSHLLVLICYLFLMDQTKFDNFTCKCVNTQNKSWVYKIQCMIIRESQVLMKRTGFFKDIVRGIILLCGER